MLDKNTYESILSTDCPVECAVIRAQTLYNHLLERGGISSVDDEVMWHNGVIDEMYEDGIQISWEVHWRYGGYASGRYKIPIAALLDDTWEAEVHKLANEVINGKSKS